MGCRTAAAKVLPRRTPRRGAGAVERGGLENRCARKRTESSNLSPSALWGGNLPPEVGSRSCKTVQAIAALRQRWSGNGTLGCLVVPPASRPQLVCPLTVRRVAGHIRILRKHGRQRGGQRVYQLLSAGCVLGRHPELDREAVEHGHQK